MSEFHVVVTEIGEIEKHPNADNLSITQVHGGYPCIIKTGDFAPGDKAVYCPIDSLVPLEDERWAFLRTSKYDPANPGYSRIKAKKLRGIFSMGVLMKIEKKCTCFLTGMFGLHYGRCPLGWKVGRNVQQYLGIKKWELPQPSVFVRMMNTESEPDPGFLPGYTDIEGLRKYGSVLTPGEQVVLMEKIHGANGRWLFKDGRLWVGSHHQIKKENYDNLWWKAAKQYDLATKLAKYPDIALYGEVYGAVQDLKYGVPSGEIRIAIFDAMDVNSRRYLNYEEFRNITTDLDLPVPPILYAGPWMESLRNLSEGQTTFPNCTHVREGFVVKPTTERHDRSIGRVILKLVGEGYLLRKEG